MTKHYRMTFIGNLPDGRQHWRGTGFNSSPGGLTHVSDFDLTIHWYEWMNYPRRPKWERSEDAMLFSNKNGNVPRANV